MTHIFKVADSGVIGKAFEMTIKEALRRKNANRVSPCGTSDFRFNCKNYDSKQNGSCIKYGDTKQYIKGSNRVIYATHVSHTIIPIDDEHISIDIDLMGTDLFVLDRKEFITFLESIGCVKHNKERNTVNIQTVYNYKKDAYHGKKGRMIEEWAREHDLDDDVIDAIYEGLI